MADAPPAPAPSQAMGDLFQTYDPQGGDSGLFAPAYIAGYQPSQAAVAAWNAQNHAVTPALVDQLRMPQAWQAPNDLAGGAPGGSKMAGGLIGGLYGAGRIPQSQTFGDTQGQVDPLALRALAQGGPYDIAARRAAIADRVAQNAAAQAAYVPPTSGYGSLFGSK